MPAGQYTQYSQYYAAAAAAAAAGQGGYPQAEITPYCYLNYIYI